MTARMSPRWCSTSCTVLRASQARSRRVGSRVVVDQGTGPLVGRQPVEDGGAQLGRHAELIDDLPGGWASYRARLTRSSRYIRAKPGLASTRASTVRSRWTSSTSRTWQAYSSADHTSGWGRRTAWWPRRRSPSAAIRGRLARVAERVSATGRPLEANPHCSQTDVACRHVDDARRGPCRTGMPERLRRLRCRDHVTGV